MLCTSRHELAHAVQTLLGKWSKNLLQSIHPRRSIEEPPCATPTPSSRPFQIDSTSVYVTVVWLFLCMQHPAKTKYPCKCWKNDGRAGLFWQVYVSYSSSVRSQAAARENAFLSIFGGLGSRLTISIRSTFSAIVDCLTWVLNYHEIWGVFDWMTQEKMFESHGLLRV